MDDKVKNALIIDAVIRKFTNRITSKKVEEIEERLEKKIELAEEEIKRNLVKGDKGDPGESIEGKPGKPGKDGKTPKKGIDYFTPIELAEIKDDVKSSIVIPAPITPDTPQQIVNKLQSLEGNQRLDASAIKNLPEMIKKGTRPVLMNAPGGVNVHNQLTAIQGGAPNEYYHLTLTEYQNLNSGGSIIGSSALINEIRTTVGNSYITFSEPVFGTVGTTTLNIAYRRKAEYVEYFDDFISTNTMVSATGNNGTLSSIAVNSGTTFVGILTANTGASSTGRAGVQLQATALLFGTGTLTLDSVMQTSTLSDNTDTYSIRGGFGDLAGSESVDGAFFRYTHATNGGRFQCVLRSNSAEAAYDSGVTVDANTWYRLTIIGASDASKVDFYINNTLVVSGASNIPSAAGRVFGAYYGINKSAGTNARTINLDYVNFIGDYRGTR